MLTLHHLEYSQSFRILWLLEELGADYKLKLYNRDPKTDLAPDAYKALFPLSTAPVISDGDFALAETNAIIDYVMDGHPDSDLVPAAGDADRAQHLLWFHASSGSLMPMQNVSMVFNLLETRTPWPISALLKKVFDQVRTIFIIPRMTALLNLMEADLGKKPYFGGEKLTVADITMVYSMYSARDKGAFDAGYPNILAWFERIEALPSFQSARAKDGRESIAFRFKK